MEIMEKLISDNDVGDPIRYFLYQTALETELDKYIF